MAANSVSPDAQAFLSTYGQPARDYAMQNAPGNVLTSGEAQRLVTAYNPTAQAPATVAPGTPGANPGQFAFDPNQYLPGIQGTAASIYNPQQAQLDALSAIGKQQTEQQKVTTNEQFDKEMKARVEQINARGAFFGGGALTQQAELGTQRQQALTGIDLQNQASQAGFLAQKAGLNAAQSQYVQEQLNTAQGGAYSKWKDQYGMYQDTLNRDFQNKQFEQQKMEAQRSYDLQLKQIKEANKNNKKQYKLEKARLDASQSQFDKELSYKYSQANKKSSGGVGGVDTDIFG